MLLSFKFSFWHKFFIEFYCRSVYAMRGPHIISESGVNLAMAVSKIEISIQK